MNHDGPDRLLDSDVRERPDVNRNYDRLAGTRATLDGALGVQHAQSVGALDASVSVGTESPQEVILPSADKHNVLAERIVEYGEVVAKGMEELAQQCRERAQEVRKEARQQADQAIKFTDMMRQMSEAMIRGAAQELNVAPLPSAMRGTE